MKTSTMNATTQYQWFTNSVRSIDVMLPSLANSLNTDTVERRPVYWKYTESIRFIATPTPLVTTNSHCSPRWKPGRSLR